MSAVGQRKPVEAVELAAGMAASGLQSSLVPRQEQNWLLGEVLACLSAC